MERPRSEGESAVTSRPSIAMRPASGISSPAISLRVVDFPQPEGPSSTTNWACSTESEMSSTPERGEKRRLSPWMSRNVAMKETRGAAAQVNGTPKSGRHGVALRRKLQGSHDIHMKVK